MALLRPVTSLKKLCVHTIADNFERFIAPYIDRWEEVLIEKRPTFGPFGSLKSSILTLIIEELIKREELRYERLIVLLPEDAESLTCDEDTSYSPFGFQGIKLISRRCSNFKVLHCHYKSLRKDSGVSLINSRLTESISRLKLLQEINFCDTWITNITINIIALNCPHLRELNLQGTNISEIDVDCFLSGRSVIKYSLRKLIIDKTGLTEHSVQQCLLGLQNLTHFQSDRTIEASLDLFETAETSDAVPKFKTDIFRDQLICPDEKRLTEDFVNWLEEKFPKVMHLNISLHNVYDVFVSSLIIQWNRITRLELSSMGDALSFPLLQRAIVFCKNLITLKLEYFYDVDPAVLGKLKKLEKLTLINNIYSFLNSNEIQFENLKEIQIALFQNFVHPSKLSNTHLPYELFFSILASKNIEKVLFYDQSSFVSTLVKDLLERGCLRNLKELKVFKCPLGVDCIYELLNQTIPITDIVVGFCENISEDDVNQISTYCKVNNLATSITLALENPYYLRWLEQDTKVPS